MKYAFMSFSCSALSLAEMLATAEELGYAGLEPRLSSKHAHGIETTLSLAQRQAVKAQVEDSPVSLGCLAVSSRFADPDTASGHQDNLRKELELAADLGVPAVRVFGGQFPASISRGEAIDNVSEALAAVAAQAAAGSVTICLETHDVWCHPAHVAKVMEAVNQDSVRVNWDVLHPVRSEGLDLLASFEMLKVWIAHVHIHDAELGQGRITYAPMGTGAIDHRTVLKALHGIGYSGYLSGEWIGFSPWHEHLPFEISQLRAYETELGI